MIITETISATRQTLRAYDKAAFVPTMGNLHEGHLELVRQAKKYAERVIVSIFVNPLQFGQNEDFDKYPRTFQADKEKLESVGTDILFFPPIKEIYPQPFDKQTLVSVPKELSSLHCGHYRPGHFEGVATVVSKLFNIVQPDIALFGEKDFQQCCVIKTMVEDLCMPIDIKIIPTVREKDGLAMSSRNNFLSLDERAKAPAIYQILKRIKQDIQNGHKAFRALENQGNQALQEAGFAPQYLSICRQSDLQPAEANDKDLVILVAAFLGQTRLIDNVCVYL